MGSSIEKNIINLLAFLTVYGNASLIKTGSPLIFHISMLLCFLLYIIYFQKLLKIKATIILIAILTIISSIINFSNEINISNLFSFTFYLIFFSILITKHKSMLFDRMSYLIHLLAICSILIKITIFAFPFLWSMFPISYNVPNYGPYYNAFIFTQPVSITLRNQSIFWEPGAWAVNQTIAYYWLIVVKKKHKLLITYALSILLTFSTSGILLFFIIVLYLLVHDKKFRKKYRKTLFVFSSAMIFLFIQLVSIIDPEGFLLKNSISKIESTISIKPLREYYDQDTYVKKYNTWGSFEDRLHTYAIAYYKTLESPFLGFGRVEGRSESYYQTSIFGQILIQHGFIYLFIWVVLLYRSIILKSGLIKIMFILLLTYAEPYAFSTVFTFLIAFGANINKQLELNNFSELYNKKLISTSI